MKLLILSAKSQELSLKEKERLHLIVAAIDVAAEVDKHNCLQEPL